MMNCATIKYNVKNDVEPKNDVEQSGFESHGVPDTREKTLNRQVKEKVL